MDINEIKAALDAANTQLEANAAKLDAVIVQFEKGINEVIIAIQSSAAVPQEVVDAVNRLNANVSAETAKVDAAGQQAQTLDDLNPDAAP